MDTRTAVDRQSGMLRVTLSRRDLKKSRSGEPRLAAVLAGPQRRPWAVRRCTSHSPARRPITRIRSLTASRS